MNPFDMSGPEFLFIYVVVLGVGTIAAVGFRRWLRSPGGAAPTHLAGNLSPYEIAYLAGGAQGAVDAAIVRLLHQGVLRCAATPGKLARGNENLPSKAEPIEKVVSGAVGTGGDTPTAKVRAAVSATTQTLDRRLVDMGLVLSGAQRDRVQAASAFVILAIGCFGLIKVFVGVSRERPVGILIALLVLTAIVALVFFLKRPLRSRRGDAVLAQLRHENSALQYGARKDAAALAATDLVLAFGLFGTGILAGGPLRNMLPAFKNAQGATAAGSSGSSCGGTSGCGGGGGGCGGGGCGGGCGGCGGG